MKWAQHCCLFPLPSSSHYIMSSLLKVRQTITHTWWQPHGFIKGHELLADDRKRKVNAFTHIRTRTLSGFHRVAICDDQIVLYYIVTLLRHSSHRGPVHTQYNDFNKAGLHIKTPTGYWTTDRIEIGVQSAGNHERQLYGREEKPVGNTRVILIAGYVDPRQGFQGKDKHRSMPPVKDRYLFLVTQANLFSGPHLYGSNRLCLYWWL